MNYYNEFDKHAAAWLRELISDELIPEGDVDERSITDVETPDLRGYSQIHFFAGIGGWPIALRWAGWPDGRPIVTGSCPCQPFSCAGKRRGRHDARHLWPRMFHLVAELGIDRFPTVVGEQVASADGRTWLSGVRTDLEILGYMVGAADLCAAGVGAPHIRQRLYWCGSKGMDNSAGPRREDARIGAELREERMRECVPESGRTEYAHQGRDCEELREGVGELPARSSGQWSNYRIIPLRDGTYRRIDAEPVHECLVDGLPAEMGHLRSDILVAAGGWPKTKTIKGRNVILKGMGNAICVPLAAEFLRAVMEM